MIGILYLILCMITGLCFCSLLLCGYKDKVTADISFFVLIPAWFVSGILLMSWTTYIFACVFSNSSSPLSIANIITILLFTSFCVAFAVYVYLGKASFIFPKLQGIRLTEYIIFGVILLLISYLMFSSFSYHNGNYYIALSVFSDFTPHLSMIRSFSIMQNFPTEYSVFAGEDIKYHFMFEFLTGNLEFLGLRLDLAFNILSILSMLFAYFLLYALAFRITGKKTAGYLTLLFMTFRSSYSFWDYVRNIPEDQPILKTLFNNSEYIGITTNENWGLYNLNVYCNQRHLAFGLCVLLLSVIFFLPYVEAGFDRCNEKTNFRYRFKEMFITADGWSVSDVKGSVAIGLILGALAFYNGAVLIASILILFFMAVLSSNRLDYVISASIAGILALIQSHGFIKESGFDLKLYYGYLSEQKTVTGSIDFLLKMMGLLPLFLIVCFLLQNATKRYLMAVFSVPLIFAFNISLTPDISVNHKYVMIAVILLNIFAADCILRLIEKRDLAYKITAILICFVLTVTGIYDFSVLSRKNKQDKSIELKANSQITDWIAENCDNDDMFLTDLIYLSYGDPDTNYVLMSGAMLYLAWPYFAWSAGYDTYYRNDMATLIYNASSLDDIRSLVSQEGIDYIVVDRQVRMEDNFLLNEDLISEAFRKVFSTGDSFEDLVIYATDIDV